ncbi:MAG: serine hydrolase [Myxococcales bacterium]|nr:serine hydrolase [Myxococcales bacterium]
MEDQNARTAGGQTGHAGLFSTGEGTGVLARALLRAHAGDASPLPGARLREFTTRRRLVPGSSFALGWDTPTRGRSTAGDRISRDAFGHTGWTGTSLWIDPTRGVYVVLLSNRVHPRHTPAGQRAMYRARVARRTTRCSRRSTHARRSPNHRDL